MRRLAIVVGIMFVLLAFYGGSLHIEANAGITGSLSQDQITVDGNIETIVLDPDISVTGRYISSDDVDGNLELTATSLHSGKSVSKNYTYDLSNSRIESDLDSMVVDGFSSSDFPEDQQTNLRIRAEFSHPDIKSSTWHETVAIANNQVDYTSCQTIYDSDPDATSDVYTITMDGGSIDVYCEMNSNGGWMKLQTTNDQPYIYKGWGYFDKDGVDIVPDVSYFDYINDVSELESYQYNPSCIGQVTATISYKNPETGVVYTEEQISTIQSYINDLSTDTSQVTWAGDDDWDNNQHEIYVNGRHLTPYTSHNEEFDYGIWDVSGFTGYDLDGESISGSLSTDGKSLLPQEVTFECADDSGAGGTSAWGYETGYALVK